LALPGHRLHRLADEEAEQLVLAAAILGDLVGVGGEDLVDLGVDRAGVAGLLEARAPRRSRRILAGLEHDLEHLLGERAGERAVGDQAEQLGALAGVTGLSRCRPCRGG
jgi:hypothetical protein